MKPRALVLGIVVSVLLLAAAGVFYTLAGTKSGQQYRTVIELVRQIQQLSSGWSIEIARVRADPFADFDSLAAFIPRMARLKGDLADAARRISDLPDQLSSEVRGYLSALAAQEERIERFKTGYAVVRNSTRFLPLAATNVTRQAQESGDAALSRSIAMLMQDMNIYIATPTDAGKERLTADMDTLRAESVAYPPPLANALANMLAHAEVLIARQAPTDALFQEATSNEIADLADRLAGNLEFERARQATLAVSYERGILAVVGVLALFWIVLAVQQRTRDTGTAAAPEASAESVGDAVPGTAAEMYDPLRAMELQDDIGSLPLGAIDRELSAAAAASPAGLSAETAMLYEYLAERVGENVAAAAERVAKRIDHLRAAHQRVYATLRDSEVMVELPDGTDLDDELEAGAAIAHHVRREVNGIADLARRLASFSGLPNGDVDREMVDVNACIDDVVVATRADRAATVSTRLGDVPEIFASRTEIRLLLAQIIENSVRAVEELEERKGTIKIDTSRRNEEIQITVIDNGAGIPPERRRQIFRPFYTSRDGAMGLGLTMAGHLVKRYEGGIKVNSLPGQGTVTRITLPTGIPGP